MSKPWNRLIIMSRYSGSDFFYVGQANIGRRENLKLKPALQAGFMLMSMEARDGIKPAYADLQFIKAGVLPFLKSKHGGELM